jgi:hypothetical protein
MNFERWENIREKESWRKVYFSNESFLIEKILEKNPKYHILFLYEVLGIAGFEKFPCSWNIGKDNKVHHVVTDNR